MVATDLTIRSLPSASRFLFRLTSLLVGFVLFRPHLLAGEVGDTAWNADGRLTFTVGTEEEEEDAANDGRFAVGRAVAGSSQAVTATDATRSADTLPYLGTDGPSVTEGDAGATTLTFTARLTDENGRAKTSSQRITASYRVSSEDGATATAGRDYRETSGSLTFAPGETSKTIGVVVVGDTEEEDDETLTLRWTEWDGKAVLLASYTATGTIVDDDEAAATAVTLSTNPTSVGEGSGSTAVTVTATADAAVSSATEVTVSVGGGERDVG